MLALELSAASPPRTPQPSRSGNLTKAPVVPPFALREKPSGWWLLSPEGKPFFSLGVNVVTPGIAQEELDPDNPAYCAWKHYSSTADWSDATLRRLKSWRFTTIGGWSDLDTLRKSTEHKLCLTPVLHIGSTAGAPWWDMWDPKVIARMDTVAREQILPLRDDPRLLGYYSDNEMGWWNAALWKMTLDHAPSSKQRRRLIALLRETYHGDWQALCRDFQPEKAASWRELRRGGMLYLKPGGAGLGVMRQFLGLMADRYYQLVHQIIRKYDQRALILGDRYQSFYYPEVARAAGRWVDAISSNLNASWNDGSYLRCYLDTLHQLTGKPVLVSEFYLAANENRSGNRNNQGIFPVVSSQTERVAAMRRTLTDLVLTPYVVGADWFQFFDEPQFGRDDGENFNFGLVDTQDRAYEELTMAFGSFDAGKTKLQPASSRPNASDGIPPAPRNPFEDFQPTRALKHWDRERGFVLPVSSFPLADLYVCWSSRAIYLGLYALDVTENAFYRDNFVPKNDRASWIVHVKGCDPVRIRLGAGREPIPSRPDIRMECLSGVDLTVRSIAAIELTATQLGRDGFKAGDQIEFSSAFSAHAQGYRTEWDGRFTLRE
jgi:hypothetical protein